MVKELPKRFANVPALAPGRKYIVIGAYCWGASPELLTALENCRKASSREFQMGRSKCLVYDCPADARITDMGDISYAGSTKAADRPKLLGKF